MTTDQGLSAEPARGYVRAVPLWDTLQVDGVSNRNPAHALEMKRGMPRILLKKRELTIRKLADGHG
jgi:hypothetical protein